MRQHPEMLKAEFTQRLEHLFGIVPLEQNFHPLLEFRRQRFERRNMEVIGMLV